MMTCIHILNDVPKQYFTRHMIIYYRYKLQRNEKKNMENA